MADAHDASPGHGKPVDPGSINHRFLNQVLETIYHPDESPGISALIDDELRHEVAIAFLGAVREIVPSDLEGDVVALIRKLQEGAPSDEVVDIEERAKNTRFLLAAWKFFLAERRRTRPSPV